MSMIRVENLTFAYPSSYDNIFENVNFQIDTDRKIEIVGKKCRVLPLTYRTTNLSFQSVSIRKLTFSKNLSYTDE